MLHYLDKNNKTILWFGTLAANRNVWESVLGKLPNEYSQRIVMISYESIWRSQYRPDIDFKGHDIGFIVFDESHRALANTSYGPIVEMLNDLKCDRVAMSATQQRTDGIRSFRVLTPNAIWEDYNCNWATENKIINKLNYLVCATSISNIDMEMLDTYRKLGNIYDDIKDRCRELDFLISKYNFNKQYDFANIIINSGMDLDASGGARHIVFYNKIRTMLADIETIHNAFSMIYPGANVRIFTYHSKQNPKQSLMVLKQAVNSEPLPNTVDVIMTVDKGSESIHPRKIKSVSFFRETSSYIKFTQQVGRAITLRSISNDEAYIFDFSDGCVTLLRGNTIGYGRRSVLDRLPDYKVESLEDIETKIKKSIAKNVEVHMDFATKQLMEISDKLTSLSNTTLCNNRSKTLETVYKNILKNNKQQWSNLPTMSNLNTLLVMNMIDGKIDVNGLREIDINGFSEEFQDWIAEMCYKLTTDTLEKDSYTYELFKSMGCTPYLSLVQGSSEIGNNTTITQFKAVEALISLLNKYGFKCSDIKPKTKAYKILMTLRAQNIHNMTSVELSTYARHNNIDLSLDSLSFKEIVKVSTQDDKEAYNAFYTEYKIAEKLKGLLVDYKIDRETTEGKQEYKDRERLWAQLMAYHTINRMKYQDTYSRFIIHKLITDYRDEYKFIQYSETEDKRGLGCVRILEQVTNSNVPISGMNQEFIFDHAEFNGLTLVERCIFAIYGIKTKVKYATILNHNTEWGQLYNQAINGDRDALVKISRTNVNNLDIYRQKLLRTQKFKMAAAKDKEGIAKDIILAKVKSFFMEDNQLESEIKNALRDKTVTPHELIEAAFPKHVYEEIHNYLEWNMEYISVNIRSDMHKLVCSLKSRTSCTSLILQQLCNIIKEEDPGTVDKIRQLLKY